MRTQSTEVLIVGAGIAGVSIAFELASRGIAVTVAERGALCAGSSALNAGGVRHQFSSETNIRCAIGTMQRLGSFHDEHGIDIQFRRAGYLLLYATAEQQAKLEGAVANQHNHGISTRMIGPDEIARLVPGLNVADVKGGSWGPDDGYLDPPALVRGYAEIARRAGADILEGHPVTAFEVRGARIAGLTAGDQRFAPDIVVNAAGVWAPRIAQLYGADLPITARRSSLWVAVSDRDDIPEWVPQIIDLDTRTFFHSEANGDGGIVFGLGGADLVPDEPRTECNWSRLPEAQARMVHRFPLLKEVRIDRGWAGFVEATEDDNPIVGWTHLDNVYTAAGFSGHGMCIAPGLAPYAAAEIDGRGSDVPLDAFRLERFATGQIELETMFGVSTNVKAAGL